MEFHSDISTGADVKVDYTNGGQANLTFNNMGKHTGSDQAWTIKAAIYNEAATKGELQNLSFKIYGPKELIGETIKIKCCPEEYVNGAYSNDIYEEKEYTFERAKDGSAVLNYSLSFNSTNDSYDLLFGLGLLDFKNAVKDVVSYLSQKHTSIAYLGGKEIIHDKLYHDQRKEYFERYCKEYNIDYFISEETFSIESGFNMTYELIKNKKLPSAIFAASDPIAIGAMRALKQYDIKIPEEVSIIGFDNIETTNYTDPPLTTVFAPTFDMGFMAARQLFDAFKHNENISPIKILLPCFLIERNSCI